MLTASLSYAAPAAEKLPSVGEVYDDHVDFVVRMARGLGVPPSGVDDVVQDVFLVVHEKLATFEGRAQLRTWIARIVLNVVRSHRRAYKKSRSHDPIDDEPIDAAGKTPDQIALERQAMRLLSQILEEMPDEQRTVFVLSEIEGLPMHEIASVEGVSANTASSRLRLARKVYERGVERARAKDEWRRR